MAFRSLARCAILAGGGPWGVDRYVHGSAKLANAMDNDVWNKVENLVLRVHRRNGGQLSQLDFDLRLLDAGLMLDSLDLAEIVAEVEREFRVSPFEAAEPPTTWRALAQQLVRSRMSGVVETE